MWVATWGCRPIRTATYCRTFQTQPEQNSPFFAASRRKVTECIVKCTYFRTGRGPAIRQARRSPKTGEVVAKNRESRIELPRTGNPRVPFVGIRRRRGSVNQAAAFVAFLEWISSNTVFWRLPLQSRLGILEQEFLRICPTSTSRCQKASNKLINSCFGTRRCRMSSEVACQEGGFRAEVRFESGRPRGITSHTVQ